MANAQNAYKNPSDRAIVVGISRYPGLGNNGSANLDGPENDVKAIVEWLTSNTGGGVPPNNVFIIRSGNYPSPAANEDVVDAMPNCSTIEKEFRRLQARADKNA